MCTPICDDFLPYVFHYLLINTGDTLLVMVHSLLKIFLEGFVKYDKTTKRFVGKMSRPVVKIRKKWF